MEQWKEYQLGDLLNFRRGHDLPKSEMIAGDIPVAGSNGVIGFHNEATPISPCITIGRSGNVGTPNFYEKCWAHNTVLYIDDFKENNPEFLFYLLKTIPLKSFGGGSAVPTLNRNHIHPIVIKSTKDIKLQQKIVEILKSLDDKIELNRQINDNLEQQVQALFKSWFVDFEPFKDGEFVDSELGMIPKGWKIGTLGDIADVSSGKRPPMKQSEMTTDINIPLIGASSVMGFTNEVLYNKAILVIGRVGTHGIVQRFNTPCWPSDNTLVIETTFYEYVNQILRVIDYKSLNRGSTQPLITQTDLKNQMVLIPNEKVLCDYNEIASKAMIKFDFNLSEINHLVTIRDTLLPRLMSGELKINELNY